MSDWREDLAHIDVTSDDDVARLIDARRREVRISDNLTYVGPFVWGCDHGCTHLPNNHAAAIVGCSSRESVWRMAQRTVQANALAQIRRAHFMYARLDSALAFGTFAEIGAAVALEKPVFLDIGNFSVTKDMWFIIRSAMSTLDPSSVPHNRALHLIPWWTRRHHDVGALLTHLEAGIYGPG